MEPSISRIGIVMSCLGRDIKPRKRYKKETKEFTFDIVLDYFLISRSGIEEKKKYISQQVIGVTEQTITAYKFENFNTAAFVKVITAFALANGFEIVYSHNDFRSDTYTDYKWLDEYFSNAHKAVQYLLLFSIERLGSDVQVGIEAAKYLSEKYGVKVISARQPEVDFTTINPDDINKHH